MPLVRRRITATRPDGTPLGGPGPAPRQPEPKLIHVACPSCERSCELSAHPMALKLWSSLPIGEGEARLGGKTKDALDAVEPIGWDVRCAGCRLGFRLLYTLDEWGKMSNAFFPVIGEVVYPEP